MPRKARALLTCLILVTLAIVSCCPRISLNGKSIKVRKIGVQSGDTTDPYLFERLIQRNYSYGPAFLPYSSTRALLALPELSGNTIHVFDLQLHYKKDDPFRKLTGVKQTELLRFAPDNISIDPGKLANFDFPGLQTLCAVVNANPGLSFKLIPVMASKDTPAKSIDFIGIYTQRDSCPLSSIDPIHSINPHLSTYHEGRINCLPQGFAGNVVTDIRNGGALSWFTAPKPKTPSNSSTTPKPKPIDTLTRESFPYTCSDNADFLVTLYRNKGGEIRQVGVVNRVDPLKRQIDQQLNVVSGSYPLLNYTVNIQVPAANDKNHDSLVQLLRTPFPGSPTDTVLSVSLSQAQPQYLIEPSDGADSASLQLHTGADRKIDAVHFTLYARPRNDYPYDVLFDAASFQRWLEFHYPPSKGICSGDLAFQIHLRDSAFFRCVLCKPGRGDSTGAASVAAKKDTSSSAKAKNRHIKPGTIAILPSPPQILTPSSYHKYIPVDLQLSGDYDSSACQVPFIMKFNALANHLRPADSTVTITKQAWDSAINFHLGRLRVEVPFKYDSTVDSLGRTQVDYLVINDSVQSGRKEIRLMNFNPASPFWLEMGSNFELLNSFKPQNIYAGIILFDKDAADVHAFGKDLSISFIGGAYESLASSSAASSDSGIIYRNNTSFTLDPTHNGYPVYHDTGSVTITSVTRNIGLMIEPAVRLTSLPTNHNGAHLFAALYNELLWQTVTTSNDYSKLATDSSLIKYVTLDTLHRYHFKQNTSITDDYRASYIGIGIPFYLKRNSFTFFANPVFGFTNQHFTPIRPYANYQQLTHVYRYPLDSIPSGYPVTYLEPRHRWNPFYILQFRFNEEKYDITVTGEIRTLLLRNSSPLLTLTISKKFDLASLIKSVLAPSSKSSN